MAHSAANRPASRTNRFSATTSRTNVSAGPISPYYQRSHRIKLSAIAIVRRLAYGPRIHGLASSKSELEEIVQHSLERAGLWEEVKDGLHKMGTALSGGQQQRLVIARAIAVNPEIILMDEPCSALDPIATAKIEELIDELRQNYCILIVTHSMSQAARISQDIAFFHMGRLVETGPTEQIFTNPREKRTHDYVTGRYG